MEKFDYLQITTIQERLTRKAEYCLRLGSISSCDTLRRFYANGDYTLLVRVAGPDMDSTIEWEASRITREDDVPHLNYEKAQALDKYLEDRLSYACQYLRTNKEILDEYYNPLD